MARNSRDDSAYEIEALTKGIKVLEALKAHHWQPVTVQTVMERTEYSRDTVDRSLKTLRMHGYAICEKGKWTIGKRLISIAASVSAPGL